MSNLVSFALRLIVCRALLNKTFAGARVLNQPVEPLDDLLADGAPKIPLLAVFTSDVERDGEGRDLTGAEQTIGISIQVLIPPEVEIAALAFKARGAGAAALIDFTWRQVARALVVETGPWAKLFSLFVAHIEKIMSNSVLYEVTDDATRRGLRIPAAEFSMSCRTVMEPKWGRPLANHWLALDEAMRTEAELVPLADMVKDLIEKPDGMPNWRVIQAAFGFGDAEMRASGLMPADITESGEPALLEEDGLTIEPADLTISTPFTPTPTVP
jgi:hypothetical protein